MNDHWLVRESTIKWLWAIFIALLTVTVLADLVIEHHSYFTLDGTFGFGAWFGFISCVAMVVFAKLLGVVLKRPDIYYDE
jgi:uncharacterized membrane protein